MKSNKPGKPAGEYLLRLFHITEKGHQNDNQKKLIHKPIWELCGYKTYEDCLKSLNLKLTKYK